MTGRAGTYAAEVLEVVAAIPAGHVLTYGDIADLLGWGAARAVGAALARSGDAVPWWRVVRADGTLPDALARRAHPHWAAERTPRRAAGVAVERARWQGPDAWP